MEKKNKLSFDEQISDLKRKNVKFDLYSEDEAKKFLQYNNYYFKLKSYAHNFSKYSKIGVCEIKSVNTDLL